MARQTWGRCPDCGAAVLVTPVLGKAGEIAPHACSARYCEYERCRVKALIHEMVQFPTGEWYCPHHGLLLAARDLVSLRSEEHTSELQSRLHLVCRLLLEKKKNSRNTFSKCAD